MGRTSLQREQNLIPFDLHGNLGELEGGIIWDAVAGQDVKPPAMPGALQLLPAELADLEGPGGMRTTVEACEELPIDPADEVRRFVDLHGGKAGVRQLIDC